MFTGIIETIGTIIALNHEAQNLHLSIKSSLSNELKIDQSIAHNGVCLTVVAQSNNIHIVTAIHETLLKTNLNQLNNILVKKGSICIDGTSLTLVEVQDNTFSVAIIPYTYEHTTFGQYKIGSVVNIEFDIVGKYLTALFNRQNQNLKPQTNKS